MKERKAKEKTESKRKNGWNKQKKTFLSFRIFPFLFLFSAPAFAQQNLAAQARQKYDSGDYAASAVLFQSAVGKSPDNPFLQYDLGNALFKSGKLGEAIVSYQRAFDLMPRNSDIRYNLAFALKRAGEDLVPSGIPPILFYFFYWLSLKELSGSFWMFTWIFLLSAGIWIKMKKPAPLRPLISISLILCSVFGIWWGIRFLLEPNALGVIITQTAEVRSGPGESFSVNFTAPEGRRVEILSASSDWIEVGLLKEGSRGWVSSKDVEKI